jgi:nucleoside-diphosphate-sugar epimerase
MAQNRGAEQSRDFTYVANAVEANWLAAIVEGRLNGEVFNVSGSRCTGWWSASTRSRASPERRRTWRSALVM